jgi:hypothetical protein
MNAVAQHWFIELSAGSSEAREQKRTLLAMPVRVLPIDNMRIQSNASINFKQYSFYDLERAGLIVFGVFSAPVPYTHLSDPITQWRLTELGAAVVDLLKEAS